jgi:hypothetical protein
MTVGIVSSAGVIGATCSLVIRFDAIKLFLAPWLLISATKKRKVTGRSRKKPQKRRLGVE